MFDPKAGDVFLSAGVPFIVLLVNPFLEPGSENDSIPAFIFYKGRSRYALLHPSLMKGQIE